MLNAAAAAVNACIPEEVRDTSHHVSVKVLTELNRGGLLCHFLETHTE